MIRVWKISSHLIFHNQADHRAKSKSREDISKSETRLPSPWSLSPKPQYCEAPRQGVARGEYVLHPNFLKLRDLSTDRPRRRKIETMFAASGAPAPRAHPAPPPCRTHTYRPQSHPPRRSSPVGPGTRVVPPRAWPCRAPTTLLARRWCSRYWDGVCAPRPTSATLARRA